MTAQLSAERIAELRNMLDPSFPVQAELIAALDDLARLMDRELEPSIADRMTDAGLVPYPLGDSAA